MSKSVHPFALTVRKLSLLVKNWLFAEAHVKAHFIWDALVKERVKRLDFSSYLIRKITTVPNVFLFNSNRSRRKREGSHKEGMSKRSYLTILFSSQMSSRTWKRILKKTETLPSILGIPLTPPLDTTMMIMNTTIC